MAAMHSDIDQRIGAALRNARLSRAQTQAELAVALGVSRSTLALYESGRRPLSASTLVAAARTLQLPTRQLLPADGIVEPESADKGASLVLPVLVEPVAMMVRILEEHPALVPSVLDLLATLLEHEQLL